MVRLMSLLAIKFCVCSVTMRPTYLYEKLVVRMQEFEGQWFNPDMPDFKPELPTKVVVQLIGDDRSPDARTVAFVGFCVRRRCRIYSVNP